MKGLSIRTILVLLLIAGCSAQSTDEIVGMWYDTSKAGGFEFFKDGSLLLHSEDVNLGGQYSFPDETHIRFELEGIGALVGVRIGQFQINDNHLIITWPNGKVKTFTRDKDEVIVMQRERVAAANRTKILADIEMIEKALKFFRLDNFIYPTTEQGLSALHTKPSGLPIPDSWNPDGYFDVLPTDPWGRPYEYRQPGKNGEIDVFSLGKDGLPGGIGENEDIGNW